VTLYPSIPHLPGSRTAGDHAIGDAEARRCTEAEKPGDVVIVEEKLDGSCVAIVRDQGKLHARGRDGSDAAASPNEGRRLFARWVAENTARLLPMLEDGEHIAGEWLALVHGIRYALPHGPFVVLDLFQNGERRAPRTLTRERAARATLPMPGVVQEGHAIAVGEAMRKLGRGFSGAIDPPEGIVYRVERNKAFAFACKWVRHDKIDGALLPEKTGKDALWNWRP
jgi:hypothetical protein